jgi:hypothetical protein
MTELRAMRAARVRLAKWRSTGRRAALDILASTITMLRPWADCGEDWPVMVRSRRLAWFVESWVELGLAGTRWRASRRHLLSGAGCGSDLAGDGPAHDNKYTTAWRLGDAVVTTN